MRKWLPGFLLQKQPRGPYDRELVPWSQHSPVTPQAISGKRLCCGWLGTQELYVNAYFSVSSKASHHPQDAY